MILQSYRYASVSFLSSVTLGEVLRGVDVAPPVKSCSHLSTKLLRLFEADRGGLCNPFEFCFALTSFAVQN